MEQLQSPDAARANASFREKLRVFRNRGIELTALGKAAGSQVLPDTHRGTGSSGKPDTHDAAVTAWSDTQRTDTAFDSGDR